MDWDPDSLTPQVLDQYRKAAESAWGDDTRHENYIGHPNPAAGQCYVTSAWLTQHLGGGVGSKDGHYFWVSPDRGHVVDLTGDQFAGSGPVMFKRADHQMYKGLKMVPSGDFTHNPRVRAFSERANAALKNGPTKTAGPMGADPYPGEQDFNDQRAFNESPFPMLHDDPYYEPEKDPHSYRFVWADGKLKLSPVDEHEQLLKSAGAKPDEDGPTAVGYADVKDGHVTWRVASNVGLQSLRDVLLYHSRQVGWKFDGLAGIDGKPKSQDLGPVMSYYWRTKGDEVQIAKTPFKKAREIQVTGSTAYADELHPGLIDWAGDMGYKLAEYPGGGNMLDHMRVREDLQMFNNGDPNFRPEYLDADALPDGPFKCKVCGDKLDTFDSFRLHMRDHEPKDKTEVEDGHFPGLQLDDEPLGFGSNPKGIAGEATASVKPFVMELAGTHEASRLPEWEERSDWFGYSTGHRYYGAYDRGQLLGYAVVKDDYVKDVQGLPEAQTALWEHIAAAKGSEPKDMIQAPVPFVYDIPSDKLHIGHQGTSTHDVPGKISPGGIVEGYYEPGGKIKIQTFSTHPFSVRHLMDLWYHIAPQMEITSLEQLEKDGKSTKLAADDSWATEGYPVVNQWMAQGQVMPFSQHMPETQAALQRYLEDDAIDSGDWDGETEATRPTISPDEPFGVHQVPMHEFQNALLDRVRDYDGEEHPDFQSYHEQYAQDGDVPDHGTSRWPVITDPSLVIEDGFHRLHDYYRKGDRTVPIVYSPRHSRIAAAPKEGPDVGSYIKSLLPSDVAADTAYRALKAAGGKVYCVGGAPRDALQGRIPNDLDLMVSGLQSADVEHILNQLPGNATFAGKNFGVFHYHHGGDTVEIALPRSDDYGEGGRRADGQIKVDPDLPIADDLRRRDFTANATAVDLDTGELVDPHGGADDIKRGVLRTTHPNSFREDPSRLIRALTMHGRFGLTPDEATRHEMGANAHLLRGESPDLLNKTFTKLLKSDNPAAGIRLAHETGILGHLLPEVEDNWNFDQNNSHHKHTLGDHLTQVLDNTSRLTTDPDVRFAALLHDIGKPGSEWKDPATGESHYYRGPDGQGANHEQLGAELADNRLRKTFNLQRSRIGKVTHLINHHMFAPFTTPKGARRFIAKVGDEHADDLLNLREADQTGKGQSPEEVAAHTSADQMRDLVSGARVNAPTTGINALSINGNDLIALGIPQGPQIGQVMQYLQQEVVDDPSLNDPTKLRGLAQQYAQAQPRL